MCGSVWWTVPQSIWTTGQWNSHHGWLQRNILRNEPVCCPFWNIQLISLVTLSVWPCLRFIPGPMVWYQKFEYAVGHWLQKTAEHVFGSVLCSPGCFSLFRASALMDDNVLKRYTTTATQAAEYVQYDQGRHRYTTTPCPFLSHTATRTLFTSIWHI